jgi:hypothetical protein
VTLREALETKGLKKSEIDMRVKKAELILQEKLRKGEFSLTEKDSHILAAKKERQYKKMQKALKMDRNYKPGSAFDFET